jgi:hypothetical protein
MCVVSLKMTTAGVTRVNSINNGLSIMFKLVAMMVKSDFGTGLTQRRRH